MYDIIIVGAGPAGLSAALYSCRKNMKVLIIGEVIGGRVLLAKKIENYPGFKLISGEALINNMRKQLKSYDNLTTKQGSVKGIRKQKGKFIITTDEKELIARAVIIATGSSEKKLGVKGEEEFIGKGVSYCATCDAPFFKNKTVAIVGGGNTAMSGLEELYDHAKKVYLIHRRKELRADERVTEKMGGLPNVEFVLGEEIKEIHGKSKVQSVELKSGRKIKTDGVFIEVGSVPATYIVEGLKLKLKKSLIHVDDEQRTNVKGVYAAGDVTTKNGNLKQLVIACGEGAVAGFFASNYLRKEV